MEGNIQNRSEALAKAREAGFDIDGGTLADMVCDHDMVSLKAADGVDGVTRSLDVLPEEGVSESQVPRRQNIYGSNLYTEKPSTGFWTYVCGALQDLRVIILMFCAFNHIGLSIATEGWSMSVFNGLGIIFGIFLVFIIKAVINYTYVQSRGLYEGKNKTSAQVTRDGCKKRVSIISLVVGDIIHLVAGDIVPADGIFIDGSKLFIDKSSLSGESDPVVVCPTNPFLLSRTKVQHGHGRMLVTSVGMRTKWGRLMQTSERRGKAPMQVMLNGVATIKVKIGLTFFVLMFVALSASSLLGIDSHEFLESSSNDALKVMNYFSIAELIFLVSILEGLPLAETMRLAFALKKLMKDKALVRDLSACETMGSVSCICINETGALTTNHRVVDKIWICGETNVIEGNDSVVVLNSTIPEGAFNILLQSIFQNNDSEVVKGKDGKNTVLGAPTESALLEFGLLLGGDFTAQRRECKILKFEPLHSITKKMSSIVALSKDVHRAFCSGPPDIIISLCSKIIDATGSPVDLSEEQMDCVMDVIDALANEGLIIICLAFTDYVTSSGDRIPTGGYTLIAVIGVKNPVRAGVKDAIQAFLAAGINVKMVTRNNINTAKAIAEECGILTDDGLVLEGSDFCETNPPQEMIQNIQVLAQCFPLHKHTLVTKLRNFGDVVAIIGDGNDVAYAPPESDIRLVMGIVGTKVAKENADVIIMDDDFTTIVNLVKWSRDVHLNFQKFLPFHLTYAVSLTIYFVFTCISGFAPLTIDQMLWVNKIMNIFGILALATEPPNDRLMKNPPVGRVANFITRTMWRNTIGPSIYRLVILAVVIFDGKQFLKLSGSDAVSVLDTYICNSLVVYLVFNAITIREIKKINFFCAIFYCWVFIAVMVSIITFQMIIVQFLSTFASAAPISRQLWLLSIVKGFVSIVVVVVFK